MQIICDFGRCKNKANQSQFKPNFNPKKTKTNPNELKTWYPGNSAQFRQFVAKILKNTPTFCLKSCQTQKAFQRPEISISSSPACIYIVRLSCYTRCKRRFLSACRTSCMACIHTIDTLFYPLKK